MYQCVNTASRHNARGNELAEPQCIFLVNYSSLERSAVGLYVLSVEQGHYLVGHDDCFLGGQF